MKFTPFSRWFAIVLLLIAFALRLINAATTHPFFEEYNTELAARRILETGWPLLPSGLFYEHGLLSSYLIAPFTALYTGAPLDQWQPAHWGLLLSRWPSVLVGTLTIAVMLAVGPRLNAKTTPSLAVSISLLAAGLFALSPEGMVWGGRARMYALATLLVLLTVWLAWRGSQSPAPARYRWLALLALLAALLTQFGVMLLVPPLVSAMLAIGWLSNPKNTRPWFLRPAFLIELAALAAIIAAAILVKRFGQPLGAAPLGESGSEAMLAEMVSTVTYQTAFYVSGAETIKFLSRQFGVPHHLWLSLMMLVGWVAAALAAFLARKNKNTLPILPLAGGNLFIGLVFGLVVVEMVTLLEPFRRNPRYLVMFLPLFYLLAANAIVYLTALVLGRFVRPRLETVAPALAAGLLLLFGWLGWPDVRVAWLTPEPAYEQAFAYLHQNRQPGEWLLTMNTPAAALYQAPVDGFTVQNDAAQFLLNADSAPIDRWAGAPWVSSAAAFAAALNRPEPGWYLTDSIRQPVYFRGDWQAVLASQMEPVFTAANVTLYRTRPDRVPLPTAPTIAVKATFGEAIRLLASPWTPPHSPLLTPHSPPSFSGSPRPPCRTITPSFSICAMAMGLPWPNWTASRWPEPTPPPNGSPAKPSSPRAPSPCRPPYPPDVTPCWPGCTGSIRWSACPSPPTPPVRTP